MRLCCLRVAFIHNKLQQANMQGDIQRPELLFLNKKGKIRTRSLPPIQPGITQQGSIKSTLNQDQITRALKIMVDMDFDINYPRMTVDNWIVGFKRDLHPEKEIRIWEIFAQVYSEEAKMHKPPEKQIIYRLTMWLMNRKDDFFNEARRLGFKNAHRMEQRYREIEVEIMFRKISVMENEWCLGHPWRFEAHLIHRRFLARFWHEKTTLAQRREILSLSAEEITNFLDNSHMLCFVPRDRLSSMTITIIDVPWVTEKQIHPEDIELYKEFNAMDLPHPPDDQSLFYQIRSYFLSALFLADDCQVYFNEKNRSPSLRRLVLKTKDGPEMEYDKEREGHVTDDYAICLMNHSEKLIMYASLCVMEQKLLALTKRMCAMCGVCREAPYKSCSGCKFAHYCSVECQKKHWKEHKIYCKHSKIILEYDKAQRSTEMPAWQKYCQDSLQNQENVNLII
eukprot:Phypoly_transcript_09055.p1 GENE.Phypoly_transcript_09055~~Phypoly_transcript_09055.p1  ORF type:complete len:452 (+),score=38.65 Phypoly_transcript_09055:61-1416(+)